LQAFCARALDPLLKIADASDEDRELRLLRVPALNFEALWLVGVGDDQGSLVALRGVGEIVLRPAATVSRSSSRS
jgi:hypothetical protein